jgi:hypothetical protein
MMSLQTTLPLLGGVAGAVATVVTYNKSSNRTIDNILVPIGGFLAGSQAGYIVGSAAADMPVNTKLASVGVQTAMLGAGYWGFSAWRNGKGHTDAGAVGIGLLSTIAAGTALILIDRLTTKLLPVTY